MAPLRGGNMAYRDATNDVYVHGDCRDRNFSDAESNWLPPWCVVKLVHGIASR